MWKEVRSDNLYLLQTEASVFVFATLCHRVFQILKINYIYTLYEYFSILLF